MKDLEKQIEGAAKEYIAKTYPSFILPNVLEKIYINGVKSPEAKEYWQQGMYTQEQMLSFADFVYSDYEDSPLILNELFIEWVEQNKKQ